MSFKLKRQLSLLWPLVFIFTIVEVNGQFYGGVEDGYGSDGNLPGTMFPQEMYCSGGDADGFFAWGTDLLTLNSQDDYCSGGGSDGYGFVHSGMITINDQFTYCRGGNNDGSSGSGYDGFFFDPVLVFDGGISDGTASGTFDGLFYELSFTLGGNKDGTSATETGVTTVNEQNFYCQAGNGDGYGSYLFSGGFTPWLFCRGGSGDGFKSGISSVEELGLGIWTGYPSNEWTEATNWKLNTVPSTGTSVLIPGGAPYHPVLFESLSVDYYYGGVHECQRLDIYPQAMLTLWEDLIVNGILNVAGTLELHRQSGNSLQVKGNGEVTVKAGGTLRVLE
jgi:hypothetical protein